MAFWIGPIVVAGSIPSPMTSAPAWRTSSPQNSSYIRLGTKMRLAARHTWPAFIVAARYTRPTASATSTSSRTMAGSLPPSSRVIRLMVAAAETITFDPVAIEPVKAMLSTPGWEVSASPRSLSSQMTLSTPAGSRSFRSSPMRTLDRGVVPAGLTITVLPASSAGSSLIHSSVRG